MKLIDEIKTLQQDLNRMLMDNNKYDKEQILEYSKKLDKLIARYYLESQNK